MTLKEFKSSLENRKELSFIIENGIKIPAYFHITEMGVKTKHFMDCGGVMRKDSKITFQLWTSDDYEHRLSSYKLSAIIKKAEKLINENLDNLEIEMEYQDYTIGIYSVNLKNNTDVNFHKQPNPLHGSICTLCQWQTACCRAAA